MTLDLKIAVFEGDGIGPEIMAPTLDILDLLQSRGDGYRIIYEHLPAGAAHYAHSGEALPRTSVDTARQCDAILLAAMGLPGIRYPDGTEITPQIDLRIELGLFAGIRPVRISGARAGPVRNPENRKIDFVLIRESTEGLFFTQGKGEVEPDCARETLQITRATSEKLFEFAFKLAARRKHSGQSKGMVTCVDKANVFRAFAFFRRIFDEQAGRFSDIEANHAYVDAMALWMIQKPWAFDVLVTENMFGDILSDLGAGLMGGLGVAPSADIGDIHAVFQPCHGSAPDIAGQGTANPVAMILSAGMMLDWLGTRHENESLIADAHCIQQAVDSVLDSGVVRTPDLGGQSSTAEMAAAVREQLFT